MSKLQDLKVVLTLIDEVQETLTRGSNEDRRLENAHAIVQHFVDEADPGDDRVSILMSYKAAAAVNDTVDGRIYRITRFVHLACIQGNDAAQHETELAKLHEAAAALRFSIGGVAPDPALIS